VQIRQRMRGCPICGLVNGVGGHARMRPGRRDAQRRADVHRARMGPACFAPFSPRGDARSGLRVRGHMLHAQRCIQQGGKPSIISTAVLTRHGGGGRGVAGLLRVGGFGRF
jgi:hypothetical protein